MTTTDTHQPTPSPPAPDAPQPAPKRSSASKNQTAFQRAAGTRHQHGSVTTPLNTAAITLGTGGIAHVYDLAPIYPAVFTVVGALSGAMAAHVHMRADPHVVEESKLPRRAARYAATCIICAGGWVTWAALDSPYTPAALATLIGGLIALGPSYSSLRSKKRKTIAQREATIRANQQQTDATGKPLASTRSTWAAILAVADKRLSGVEIIDRRDWEPADDPMGFTLTCELQPSVNGASSLDQDDLKALAKTITTTARHHLKPHGIKIAPGAIHPEPDDDDAALFYLHVQLRNPLAASLDIPGVGEPADVNDGLDIGLFKDGANVLLRLVGLHTEIVGGTGSGKSALLMAIFLQLMRCDNAEIWVGGIAKLMPLITPLCLPWWRGEVDSPPFGYIAGQSHDEVMKMLFDLLCLIEDRTKLPKKDEQRRPTAAMPLVMAVLEESPRFLEDPTKYPHPRTGKKYSASEALAEVQELGRSENVHAMRLGQYGLYGAAGESGNKLKRNTGNSILLWTRADQDGPAVLGPLGNAIKASQIKNNTFYAVLGEDARLMQGKAYFGGLNDEGHSETEEIARKVVANHGLQNDLDDESASKLPYYADRWSRERQAEVLAHKNATLVAFGDTREENLTPAPEKKAEPLVSYDLTPDDENSPLDGESFAPVPDLAATLANSLREQGLDPADYFGTQAGNTTTPPKPDSTAHNQGFTQMTGTLNLDPNPTTQESTAPFPLGKILDAYHESGRTFLTVAEVADTFETTPQLLGVTMASEPVLLQSQRRRSPDHDGAHKNGWMLEDLRQRAHDLTNQ